MGSLLSRNTAATSRDSPPSAAHRDSSRPVVPQPDADAGVRKLESTKEALHVRLLCLSSSLGTDCTLNGAVRRALEGAAQRLRLSLSITNVTVEAAREGSVQLVVVQVANGTALSEAASSCARLLSAWQRKAQHLLLVAPSGLLYSSVHGAYPDRVSIASDLAPSENDAGILHAVTAVAPEASVRSLLSASGRPLQTRVTVRYAISSEAANYDGDAELTSLRAVAASLLGVDVDFALCAKGTEDDAKLAIIVCLSPHRSLGLLLQGWEKRRTHLLVISREVTFERLAPIEPSRISIVPIHVRVTSTADLTSRSALDAFIRCVTSIVMH